MFNLLEVLFPKRCLSCGKVGNFFCLECRKNIPQTNLVCPYCEKAAIGGKTHPLCVKRYGLDGLWSLGVYQPPLRDIIYKLKYRWIKKAAIDLVNVTLEYWAKYQPFLLDLLSSKGGKDWVVIPVPLHKKRKNWRGFNQAEELAKLFSQKIGLNYQESLIRVKNTKQQVGLKAFERKQNIKNAFKINPKFSPSSLNCLLIDDVWTTGSTLKECCKVLKKAGVNSVWALTLAR